jgi:hypothetical protein
MKRALNNDHYLLISLTVSRKKRIILILVVVFAFDAINTEVTTAIAIRNSDKTRANVKNRNGVHDTHRLPLRLSFSVSFPVVLSCCRSSMLSREDSSPSRVCFCAEKDFELELIGDLIGL